MKKSAERTVPVATLKAQLSEYIRAAREGHSVTVYDGETPVARLVPYETPTESLVVRKAVHGLHDVPLPPPLSHPVDSSSALHEERHSER